MGSTKKANRASKADVKDFEKRIATFREGYNTLVATTDVALRAEIEFNVNAILPAIKFMDKKPARLKAEKEAKLAEANKAKEAKK